MRARWNSARTSWDRFWFTPQSTATVELFRIVFGGVSTLWMLSLLPVWEPFFGASPAIPRQSGLPGIAWTLFTLVGGTPLIWVWWALGFLAAVALTVGLRTRAAALVVAVMMISVTRQSPGNSGDMLLRILSIYMVFMPAGSAVSVDRWLVDRHHVWDFPLRSVWALRLAQVQVSVIYLNTVWEKVGGPMWRGGWATSFALRIGDVGRFPTPAFLTDSVILTQLMTFGTVAVELSIGVLVWNRAARPWVLGLGVLLHLSIELTVAVGFFSIAVLTIYLAFVPPERAAAVLEGLRDRVGRWRSRGRQPQGAASLPRNREAGHDQKEPVATSGTVSKTAPR